MNRSEAKTKLIDTFKNIPFSELKIGDLNNVIDKIYNDLEKDLKDINNQVSRLKKQLSKGHHIKCSCYFCKPVACSYVENNFIFTNCNDCKNKIDGVFQEVCGNCKRFYGCYFEKKEM